MGYSCGTNKGYDKFDGYSELTNYVLARTATKPNGNYEIVNVKDDGKLDKIYNVQVCVDWNFPVIDAAGTWKFTGKTELVKGVVE